MVNRPYQRPADINRGLHYIRPDHRRQPAFEGVNQRKRGDDGDGSNLSGAKRNGDDNRNRINTHAFGCGAGYQKKSGGQRTQPLAETAFDQLVCGVQVATEIMGQENKADHDTAHDIAHHHLQKGEIGIVGQTRNADDGQCAGFRRNDGKRNRPPGNIPVSQKIIAQGALFLAGNAARTE